MKAKLQTFLKIYPWYYGLNADLLFFVAIDTLFLTVVKGLSVTDISLLNSISIIMGIILQIPLLKVIKKIGNYNSVRLGTFLLFLSALFFTFGSSFFILMIAHILYNVSFIFKNMATVILRNNLKLIDREKDFVRISNNASTIYAIVTAIIAFFIGPIFNINNYLPMYLCIVVACICYFFSFYIKDYNNNITEEIKPVKQKVPWNLFLILLMLFYGFSFGCICTGQGQGKIYIQNDLINVLDVESVAIILGIIVTISRGARVIANIAFTKIYEKLGNYVGVFLSVVLILCPLFLLIGHLLPLDFWIKIVIMSVGFFLILAVRDPIKVYVQDILFQRCPKGYDQELITYLAFFRSLGNAFVSLIVTSILFKFTLSHVMVFTLIVSIICFLISYKIYKIVR